MRYMAAYRYHNTNNRGFTLVELMVTLVVAFLVIAAVYASYVVQQRTQKEQEQVTRIQQNLRAGLMTMTREFKMAGYDPTMATDEYGITAATPTTFAFTADICEDGEKPKPVATVQCPGPVHAVTGEPSDPEQPNAGRTLSEIFSFRIADTDGDGSFDTLLRGVDPIAENIEQLEFSYIMENGSVQQTVSAGQHKNIRAVQVALLGRAAEPDYRYSNQQTYSTQFGTVWDPTDPAVFPIDNSVNYRRRVLMATIDLRNMGLL